MKIHSVFDPEFKPYGQIVAGLEDAVQEILKVLAETPVPAGTGVFLREGGLGYRAAHLPGKESQGWAERKEKGGAWKNRGKNRKILAAQGKWERRKVIRN